MSSGPALTPASRNRAPHSHGTDIAADDGGIAIVGYACRLPGARDAAAFWQLLASGTCAVTEVQADRWSKRRFGHPSAPGRSYTFAAGQLDDVWSFDPAFFGISPREAIQMDPQQRLLLEVTWEALEHAGIPASSLAGSGTGVFIGASAVDHSNRFMNDLGAIDAQLMTGNTLSIISNRISYIFDLKGPSFTVDTACSSSLVALHQAAEALRSGRIDTAIVGGVNLLLSPFSFIGFSRASMLSPTGLCRAFDASGDGYVRSEGAAVFVLRRTAAARANGDRIRSLIVGSGVNSDGRTVGMSLPSSADQARLLEQVYAEIGVDPDTLAFVEAHGTGTRVGDPAEAGALGRVLGARRAAPLPIGSVKTNIGHLEAASGAAGLLKAQLALEHGMLPASLHFSTPNPDIPFAEHNLAVAAGPVVLPAVPGGRHAGINSFGFGGTNAHVVLRGPEPTTPATTSSALPPLIVSAQSQEALKALLSDWRAKLASADAPAASALVNAAAWRRDRLDHRFVARAADAAGLARAIDDHLAGRPAPQVTTGRAVARSAQVAFVFSGNGSQWAGMGRAAYAANADFRTAFEATDRIFMGVAGWSLLTMLFSGDLDSDIERTEVGQPLLFALQVATVEALAARGLRPDAVTGHSVGEVAAAWASGALTLPDAVRVVHARSRHQEVTRDLGTMAALMLPAAETRAALESGPFAGLSVAADNSPRSVTISGPQDKIEAFAALAKTNRWALKRLKLDYPFHNALIDPIREPLVTSLSGLAPRPSRIPFVSTVTGAVVDGADLGPDYWWHNVREPVLFRDAVVALGEIGTRVFVEIGPRPILLAYLSETLREAERPFAALPSLDRGDTAGDPVGGIVAAALASGARVDDARWFGPRQGAVDGLPTYRWQRQVYRIEATTESTGYFDGGDHPLLGAPIRPGAAIWTADLDIALLPWLADHRVDGAAIFPAAGFVEIALAAFTATAGPGPVQVTGLDLIAPLLLDGDVTRETRVTLEEGGIVEIRSRRRLSSEDWTLHARGRVRRPPSAAVPDAVPHTGAGAAMSAGDVYAIASALGLDYGPAFRRVTGAWRAGERAIVAGLGPTADVRDEADHLLHPTLLDAAFHGLFALIADQSRPVSGRVAFLPVRIGDLRLLRAGAIPTTAAVTATRLSLRSVEAAFVLSDADGPIATLEGVRFRAVPLSPPSEPDDLVFRTVAVRLPQFGDVTELPAGWDTPGAVAARLGLTQDWEAPEAGLLIDAAAHALAHELVMALADETGVLPVSAVDSLPVETAPLLHRLLAALAVDGTAEAAGDGGGWQIGSSQVPPFETLIRAVLADHPGRVSEVTALVHARAALVRRLAGTAPGRELPASVAEHLETAAPAAEGQAEALAALVAGVLADWPADRPLRILAVGPQAGPILAPVSDRIDPRIARLTASDPDAARAQRLKHRIANPRIEVAPLDEIAGAFDLVLVAGALGRGGPVPLKPILSLASPGALVAVAAPAPSLFADLVHGGDPAWWADTIDPALPTGAGRTPDEWRAVLESEGITEVLAGLVPEAAAETGLVVALKPRSVSGETVTTDDPLLIVVDGSEAAHGVADALAANLSTSRSVINVAVAEDGPDGWRLVPGDGAGDESVAALVGARSPKEVVQILCPAPSGETPEAAIEHGMMGVHAVLNSGLQPPARLWLVVPGGAAQVTRPAAAQPVQSALWAFGRVVANEYPEVEVRLIDVAARFAASEAGVRIAEELASPNGEREIVIDERGRSGLRIVRGGVLDRAAGAEPMAELSIPQRGSLDGLRWSAGQRRAPGAGEVEIEVSAAGLNFRDVMWALGLLPDEALEDGFAGATLGMECAGTVVRAGEGAPFRPGDRVVAFAPQALATHVTVPARAALPLPAGMDEAAGATLPVAFLTAAYGLLELARLEAGETVLIHGGAGGVGLAALQVARARGAEVIATAGTPERRALLLALGAGHALDSRSVAFADEVMRLAGGKGVDVVLNSLSGDPMERSLDVLKPFGRFVELGKRDYYADTRLGLRPFRNNLSYFGVDADQLLTARPEVCNRVLAELAAGLGDGRYGALPYRVYDAAEVTEAFRLMQQSGHIGKIVIRPPAVPAPAPAAPAIRPDRTYLVAGGLGGFGSTIAEWLVAEGARHVALASRSGAPNGEAAEAIARMRRAGADVRCLPADLADAAAVERLLETVDRDMPPLVGVIHAAMVLDDALFANLDAARVRSVLAPKVAGAAHLDRLTRDRGLDLFIMVSSATTLIGNPGQAPYVAANAYLEALAVRRRAEGLPALAVAYGALGDVGYLARNTEANALLSARLGRHPLTGAEAIDGMKRLLAISAEVPAAAYARIDWAAARRHLAILATPLVRELGIPADAGVAGSAEAGLAEIIAGLDRPAAIDRVAGLLGAEIARILRLPSPEVDRTRPLSEIGMDSLMALELKMAAEQRFGAEIPLMSLAGGTTLADLAGRVVDRARPEGAAVPGVSADAQAMAGRHVEGSGTAALDPALVARVERHSERMRKLTE